MTRYITKAERDNVVAMDTLTGHIMEQILPHASNMGSEVAKRLKTATTNIKRAMEIYVQDLSEADKVKLFRQGRTSQIVLTSRAYREKKSPNADEIDALHSIAAYAIGKECRGCVRDGESCELKHLLAKVDVPYTTTEPVNCPYELEV